jgi:hypothetical protein
MTMLDHELNAILSRRSGFFAVPGFQARFKCEISFLG